MYMRFPASCSMASDTEATSTLRKASTSELSSEVVRRAGAGCATRNHVPAHVITAIVTRTIVTKAVHFERVVYMQPSRTSFVCFRLRVICFYFQILSRNVPLFAV